MGKEILGGNIDELTDAIELLSRRINYYEKLNIQSSAHDLSMKEMLVISLIAQRESTNMREIADSLMMKQSSITAIIDKLIGKKLVTRKRSRKDRRIVKVSLLQKGKDIYNQHYQAKRKLSERMLATLDQRERDSLLALLEKICGDLLKEQEMSTE